MKKIQSNNTTYCNKETNILGTKVKFNESMIAEIEDDEKADAIIEAFPGRFFAEGDLPKEETKEAPEVKTDVELEKIKSDLQAIIDEKEIELVEAKEKIQELQNGESGLTTEEAEIVYDLCKKSKSELQSDCVALELPKENWEEKTQKELVIYLATL